MNDKKRSPGQWKKPGAEDVGTLHGPSTLFIRASAGSAKLSEGELAGLEFDFGSLGLGGPGSPYVECKKTGLYFTLTWQEIISMAINAGVCKEHPDMEGK